MTVQTRIEEVFAGRQRPAEVLDSAVTQFDSDAEECLWFAGRDWHELTGKDWQEHRCAIYFFSPEAFAYYLPSLLLLSAQDPSAEMEAADVLISYLDLSPSVDGWPENFAPRFLELRSEELDVLKEWLLCICESPAYRGWGLSASGAGNRFGRAFETVNLLQEEIQRRHREDDPTLSGTG